MGIPNPESARYSSLQEFIGFFKTDDNNPSFTNLFSVHFATPPVLRQGGQVSSGAFTMERGEMSMLMDYYAKSVNLPSKQITTGQFQSVGSPYKFATGTAFSQISMTFTIPRSQRTRTLFERWTQIMASDSNQYTDFYSDYVCPHIHIYKWERGGGDKVLGDARLIRAAAQSGHNVLRTQKNKLTACWVIKNAFPYNIGSVQLDNSQAKTMDLNVQFYYERYRFYPEATFDDPGVDQVITIPSGSNNDTIDQDTDRNQTAPPVFFPNSITT